MIQNMNFNKFVDSFRDYNRQDSFSYKGLGVLYNYLIELEEDTGQNIEIDVITLCCDYNEYKNSDEYLNDYYTTDEINELMKEIKESDEDLNEDEIREELKQQIEEELNNKTTLLKFSDDLDDGFIIQAY